MYQDQTRPYGTGRVFLHQFKHGSPSGRVVTFAAIAGFLGVALAAVTMTWFLSFKNTTTTELRQLRHQLSQAQTQNTRNASGVRGLAGQVSGMGSTLNALTQFNMSCSQYLTGPGGGPATFYFPCTQTKP